MPRIAGSHLPSPDIPSAGQPTKGAGSGSAARTFAVHRLPSRSVRTVVPARVTEPVDTGTAAGKAFLDMLGVFAEFETNLRRERQLEGIALAKTRGVYKGRKPSVDAAEVRRLRHEERLGPAAIARRLGIGRTSVYRALGAAMVAGRVR